MGVQVMSTAMGYGVVVEHDEEYGWMAVDNTCGVVEHCGSKEEALEVGKRWVKIWREGEAGLIGV